MSSDPNKKSARTFQCRDVLWETFEQMARELECSVDYLINEAMKQYARQRSYGPSRTPFPGRGQDVGPQQQPQQQMPPSSGGQGGFMGPGGGMQQGPPMRQGPPPPQGGPGAPGGRLPPPPMRPGGNLPAPPPPSRQTHSIPQGGGGGYPGRTTGHGPMPTAQSSRTAPPQAPRSAPPPLPQGATPGQMAPPGRGMQMDRNPQPQMGGGGGGSNGYPQAQSGGATLSVMYQGDKMAVTKDRFVIGRGKQSSDLTLKDPNVSRQHAMIEFQNGVYFMVDMGSTNGVEYNGQRIARKQIAEGDVFKICDHDLRFTYR